MTLDPVDIPAPTVEVGADGRACDRPGSGGGVGQSGRL